MRHAVLHASTTGCEPPAATDRHERAGPGASQRKATHQWLSVGFATRTGGGQFRRAMVERLGIGDGDHSGDTGDRGSPPLRHRHRHGAGCDRGDGDDTLPGWNDLAGPTSAMGATAERPLRRKTAGLRGVLTALRAAQFGPPAPVDARDRSSERAGFRPRGRTGGT